tara:strand:- start:1647 stop:1973 length:327 start_codon:yes stop_codon:yes gene_type:complete
MQCEVGQCVGCGAQISEHAQTCTKYGCPYQSDEPDEADEQDDSGASETEEDTKSQPEFDENEWDLWSDDEGHCEQEKKEQEKEQAQEETQEGHQLHRTKRHKSASCSA